MSFKQIPKKPLIILIVFFLVIVLIIAIPPISLVRHTTHSPSFCQDCHPEVVQQWQQSRVHPTSVTCTDCHVSGWQPVPVTYEADSQTTLPNCENCHDQQKTQKEVVKKIIKISHQIHLEELQKRNLKLNCLDCHWTVAHDNGVPATNRPTMRGCFTPNCHPIEKETCQLCHFTERFFVAEKK
ncbi:MAG: NapC/NirT family cytochrome c [candidate division KSB1 bacterium]|nr:NapC/NirT family cytochrome c [candidate division KSB1 bacterium]